MRFVSLGSGSRGNATLIEQDGTRVLLDCGFAARELERRLSGIGIAAQTLDAILVTHEHQDHVRGVGALARRYGIPVWLTHGTLLTGRLGEIPHIRVIWGDQRELEVGCLGVLPYSVPHDAREPVQFVFQSGTARFGVLTDVGTITPHIIETLRGCSALLLECNHDWRMLRTGPYPLSLQRRVGGAQGHLSNSQAAEFLGHMDHIALKCLVVAHLSEKNNTPALAREALISSSPTIGDRLRVTCQDRVTGWFEA